MLPVSLTGRNRGRISQLKLALVSTASLLAMALFADNPSAAQTVAQAGQDPSRIRQVDVEAPRPPGGQTCGPRGPLGKRSDQCSSPSHVGLHPRLRLPLRSFPACHSRLDSMDGSFPRSMAAP
jgi:hypothetical protein